VPVELALEGGAGDVGAEAELDGDFFFLVLIVFLGCVPRIVPGTGEEGSGARTV
jgi:hypothetical protein